MGKYSLKMNILQGEREKRGIVINVRLNESMAQNDGHQWVQSSCCSPHVNVIILSLLLLVKILSLVLLFIIINILIDSVITVIMILVTGNNEDVDDVHYDVMTMMSSIIKMISLPFALQLVIIDESLHWLSVFHERTTISKQQIKLTYM